MSFLLVHVGQAEWCVDSFDAPYAVQPWEDFENCQREAAGGLLKCWRSTLSGSKTLLQGCRKSCTTCQPSGADVCDEASWPNKHHGIVCGECKVLVDKFEDQYRTCAGYCASLGKPCTGAWEQWEDTCAVKQTISCDARLASSTAICQCLPHGAPAPTAFQAKNSSSVAKDTTDPEASDDGTIRFMVLVIVGSSLIACLLCLSMYMFFRCRQATRTLRQRGDSQSSQGSTISDQSSPSKAIDVVLGNPVRDTEVGLPAGADEKDAAPAIGIVVGNPVNVGENAGTPSSGGPLLLGRPLCGQYLTAK